MPKGFENSVADVADAVSGEVFEKWLTSSQCLLSEVLLQWWRDAEPAAEGEVSEIKGGDHDTPVDFWRRIVEDVRQAAKPSADETHVGPSMRLSNLLR